jgi:hypothetical protein
MSANKASRRKAPASLSVTAQAIREGTAPDPVDPPEPQEEQINIINSKLGQARAIVDLVSTNDPESLFDGSLGWALHAVCDFIADADQAATELHSKYWALKKAAESGGAA